MRNAAREVLGLAQYKAGQLDAAMTDVPGDHRGSVRSHATCTASVQIYIQQLLAEGAALIVTDGVDHDRSTQ